MDQTTITTTRRRKKDVILRIVLCDSRIKIFAEQEKWSESVCVCIDGWT